MSGACSTYWERKGACRGLVGKPEGKRPLGRSGSRWEDNIEMDNQEVKLSTSEVVGFCENGNEPFGLHKLRGSSWVVEKRLDFKEGLSSMKLSLRNIQTIRLQ
jgi:hypothetical protein